MKTNFVVLTDEDIRLATDAGKNRNLVNRKAGRSSVIVVGTSIDSDIQGARAEMAVSKFFGIPWTGKFFENEEWQKWKKSGGHDVGPLEVRSTTYKYGHLPMFKDDLDDAPYILVVVHDECTYEIIGWCWGWEGRQPGFWADPGRHGRAYFCVPRRILRSIEELKWQMAAVGKT
jgi:hypothetical protein